MRGRRGCGRGMGKGGSKSVCCRENGGVIVQGLCQLSTLLAKLASKSQVFRDIFIFHHPSRRLPLAYLPPVGNILSRNKDFRFIFTLSKNVANYTYTCCQTSYSDNGNKGL